MERGANTLDAIKRLFSEVRAIANAATSPAEGVAHAVAFARGNSHLLEDQTFWERVSAHDFRHVFQTVGDWARRGLAALDLHKGWEFALLALGDCPELFQLCGSHPQLPATENPFRATVLGAGTVGCATLERVASSRWDWGADHNVRELADDILSFSRHASPPYHGSSGYFLWHVIASLSLVAPLSDAGYRADVLQGCERLYLLSGSGDMFVYIATVTHTSVEFEQPPEVQQSSS